jgi:hypothetical protein
VKTAWRPSVVVVNLLTPLCVDAEEAVHLTVMDRIFDVDVDRGHRMSVPERLTNG